jgi:tetratricopeptide (TPR) repeat protein
MTDMARSLSARDSDAEGYWSPQGYVYPSRELAEWRRRFMDYLIRRGSLEEAALLIDSIKKELAGLALARGVESDQHPPEYEWLRLASALIDVRRGRTAAAIAGLKQYCGSNQERCLKAYALLVSEGKQPEADDLLYESYKTNLKIEPGPVAALAEIEVRRGRPQEAARLLTMLVQRSVDNAGDLTIAAETAARIGMLDLAVNFREQVVRIRPDDASNRIELARSLDAVGKRREALRNLCSIASERGMPNTARAQSAELIGQIVRQDPGLAQAAREILSASRRAPYGAGVDLANGAVLEATGQVNEAASLLSAIRGSLESLARVKLGRLSASAGQNREAIIQFERAVYLDPEGVMAHAVAFSAAPPASPVARLAILYSGDGRDEAALRIAGREEAPSRAISHWSPVFEPAMDRPVQRSGIRTLAEMNVSALASREPLLAALVESALRLGQFEGARLIEGLRLPSAADDQKGTIKRRIAEILAAENARRARMASLLRVNHSVTTESIYSARVINQ